MKITLKFNNIHKLAFLGTIKFLLMTIFEMNSQIFNENPMTN